MTQKSAKPFLKWAGGKTQLLKQIEKILPHSIRKNNFTYIEPFVGSGAVLFWMLKNLSTLKKAIINDINEDLINVYKVVAAHPKVLIANLKDLQNEFHLLDNNIELKKEYYYKKRALFNARSTSGCEQASLFVFLNKTCFNGLYRVNKNNEFNVPMGSYRKPTICDDKNIILSSQALQRVEILCDDFEQTINSANQHTFFYMDPPYKPLSNTSSFNSYTREEFNDNEQIRLRNFCCKLDSLGYSWILSNSDVKENDSCFFDELYKDFNIGRVDAKRSINAKPEKRGVLTELLITNDLNKQQYARAI